MSVLEKTFTAEQLKACQNQGSQQCLVCIRGVVYDVTSWLPHHPGGTDMLLLAAGRDATHLFETYHKATTAQMLEKYKIGKLENRENPIFTNVLIGKTTGSPFYPELRKRVYDFLKQNNQDPKGPIITLLRFFFFVFGISTSFLAAMLLGAWGFFYLALGLAVVHGVFRALIQLHTMHDASHASLSHTPILWRIFGFFNDFANGVSFQIWQHQHIIGHHVYTNVQDVDPDLGVGFPIRMSSSQPWRWFHSYQHIYSFVLYPLLSTLRRTSEVFSWWTGLYGTVTLRKFTLFESFLFWGGRAFFYFYQIVLPLYLLTLFGLSLGEALKLILLVHIISEFVGSLWLALAFQLSHIFDGAGDVRPVVSQKDSLKEIDVDWAVSQLATTQDYCHDSWFFTFATGALNYQVVHHLFPDIAQYHYRSIAPVIQQVCQEFGLPYLYCRSFFEVVRSHYLQLKNLSQKPKST